MIASIKEQAEAMDMENRDPNQINAHLGNVVFEEVFGEIDSTHSIDCVWKNSFKCFTFWKNACYLIATTLCSLCIAMYWGCYFAGITFNYVWWYTPCIKACEMEISVSKRFFGLCTSCCIEPICESCGSLFAAFKK